MRDVLPEDEGGIERGVEEGFQLGVEGQAFLEGGRGGGHGCLWVGREEGREGGDEIPVRALFVFLSFLLAC